MLSWSAEATNQAVDLVPIATGSGDPLLPGGSELIEYVTAILSGRDIGAARHAVTAMLGATGAVDAAAVTGNFEMMNRIADAVGMPVGQGTRQRMATVIADLGLDRYPHA